MRYNRYWWLNVERVGVLISEAVVFMRRVPRLISDRPEDCAKGENAINKL